MTRRRTTIKNPTVGTKGVFSETQGKYLIRAVVKVVSPDAPLTAGNDARLPPETLRVEICHVLSKGKDCQYVEGQVIPLDPKSLKYPFEEEQQYM